MRAYIDLSDSEREQARGKALADLLAAVMEGAVRFNDELNGDQLQAKIDGAGAEAEDMQTPWFAHEYIMDVAGDELKNMALCNAEDAIYPEPGTRVIFL